LSVPFLRSYANITSKSAYLDSEIALKNPVGIRKSEIEGTEDVAAKRKWNFKKEGVPKWNLGTRGIWEPEGQPYDWDPHSGARRPRHQYRREGGYTRIPLTLAPYDSHILCFEQTDTADEPPHMTRSGFSEVTRAGRNSFRAEARDNGVYPYEIFDGAALRERSVTVAGLPAAYKINGNWKVRFEGVDAPARQYAWSSLPSWTDLPELRHFSGTGRYTLDFELPAEYWDEDIRLFLTLGDVGTVAGIRLNGKEVGIHWRPGQEFEITGTAQPGGNTLEVDVTNTLINRVSGLEAFPDIAPELQPRYGTALHPPAGRALGLIGFEPLPPSGLLGPVRIIPCKEMEIPWVQE